MAIGLTILQLPTGGDAEPRVCRALPNAAPGFSFPTWLTSHRELKTSRPGGDAEPRVCRALPNAAPGFSFPTWLTSHRELKTSRRIRVAFDLLAELLSQPIASG